ncbi:polysaccharide biosynthesis/export family protein [Segetibacter koreensis]|uniref:polysaccharide biosynthesis/export family protein n=1 Tax=Segetibacter koreensis TaxID=398037 RepID=UPI0012F9BF99|nr:polysaccharide biosynthesis/export family protein [Segetibacter koreensis]
MRSRNLVCICLIFFFYSTIFLLACNPQKKLSSLVYFNEQGDTTLAKSIQNYEPLIQPGDRLSIIVNALDPASAAPYNLGSSATISSAGTMSGSSSSLGSTSSGTGNNGYIVESDGTIHFPQLGKIRVAGMLRKQLVDTLSQKLIRYLTDPIVTVQFLNFKITVLGEVAKPGTLSIPDGKVTLVEAIGLAGDLPITARRDNILVIREKNGEREFGRVNMLSKNVFSSPYFVLKQNDVVYVELTKEKVAATDQSSSILRSNISLITAGISVVSTILILIVNFRK